MAQDTENCLERVAACGEEVPRRRLAYEPPRLRHLGGVREITLGSGGILADGGTPTKTARA
jgi:hypothetical protein